MSEVASNKKVGKNGRHQQPKIPVVLDVETGDYDDVLALAATHPRVNIGQW